MSDDWAVVHPEVCVECPVCAFTFDAAHTDPDGTSYSCPVCAEIRLREREAQLTATALNIHPTPNEIEANRRAEAAEARVAELSALIIEAEASFRDRMADLEQKASARVRELEAAMRFDPMATRIRELEEALREIERCEWQEAMVADLVSIARRALAHEEEDMTASPFPQPALESEEKGLFRDREIPAKPADVAHEEEA